MTKKCPLRFGQPPDQQGCIEHQCEFYTHLTGMNPQTGQPIDEFSCAIKWLPLLLVENSNQQRQTAASVDKVANEVNKTKQTFVAALPPIVREQLNSGRQNGAPALPQISSD